MRDPAPPFPAWRAALGVLTLVLLTGTGLLLGGLWNSGWFVAVPREFTPDNLDCRVVMPGAVRASVLVPGDGDGQQFAARRRFPWESFGLAARDTPDDLADGAGDPTPALDEYLRDFLATLPGGAGAGAAVATVPDADYPVRQAAVTSPRYGNVVARVVFGGPRLYLLVAAGKAVSPARPDVEGFFASFRGTDADHRRAASAALKTMVAAGRDGVGHAAFARRPYGGPPPADPASLPGLIHHWRCDGPPGPAWLDSAGAAPGTWRPEPPAPGPGVRGGAITFGNARPLTIEFADFVDITPGLASTHALWYRSTPGDGRLLTLSQATVIDGTFDLSGDELRVTIPAETPARHVRLARPADGDWHHVALVRRPAPAAAEVWLDGEVRYEGPPILGPSRSRQLAVGGPGVAGRADAPGAAAFHAALDEVCVFDRALSAEELGRLAAAPETFARPPVEPPYWLRPDTGFPSPAFYLTWDENAALAGRVRDVAGRTDHAVRGDVATVPAPAGRGFEVTPRSPGAALEFPPFPVEAFRRRGPRKAAEPGPFTAAVWASYAGDAPLSLLDLGDLHLKLSRGGAQVFALTAAQPRPAAFVVDNLTPGWHHYALTRSKTGVVKFYLDGVGVPGAVEVSATIDPTLQPFSLGTLTPSPAATSFQFSEFVVFPEACTPAQVRRIAGVRVPK